MSAQQSRKDSRSANPQTTSRFKVRIHKGQAAWISIPAESPVSALNKFREVYDPGLADDLSMVDVTEDQLKSIVLLSPAYDYELIPEGRPAYSQSQCIALRAPGRPCYTLRDFRIDKYSIPVVRPARISKNEWGVRLNDKQVKDLRNHRIVRVRTRKGDRWYSKVDAIVQRTEWGAILSVSESKFRLQQQKCKGFRAWTRHEQQVARGEIPRDMPNEYMPNQNERIKGGLQHLPGKGTPSAEHEHKDKSPAQVTELPENRPSIDTVQAQFAGVPNAGWER